MTAELYFDTLGYTKHLERHGIENGQAYAEALDSALRQNLYSKNEVDKMNNDMLSRIESRIDTMFNRFEKCINKNIDDRFQHFEERFEERFTKIDDRFVQIDQRFAQIDERFTQIDERFNQIDARFAGTDRDILKLENRFEKMMNRYLITTIGVLGSLIVFVGAVSTFAHHIIN